MKKFLCAWGNCDEEMDAASRFAITVTVKTSVDAERNHYCCYEHAALAMAKADRLINGVRQPASQPKSWEQTHDRH